MSHAAFGGVTLGHAWIDRSRVSYLEIPFGEGYAHWALCLSDGVDFAIPLTPGPLVPGRPEAPAEAILARLAHLVEEPPNGSREGLATAVGQVLPPRNRKDHPAAATVFTCLRTAGWPGSVGIDAETNARFEEWLKPLERLLDERLRILETFDFAKTNDGAIPVGIPGIVGVNEARDRILRLTHAGTQVVGAFMDGERYRATPLFVIALRSADIRLDTTAGEIRSEVLAKFGAPTAAIRRVPAGFRATRPLARGLACLPIDWIPGPDAEDEWDALNGACGAMATLTSWFSTDAAWPGLAKGSKGRWVDFLERCRQAALDPGRTPNSDALPKAFVASAAANANDVVRAFTALLGSITGADAVSGLAYRALNDHRSLPSILRNSRDWHERFRPTATRNVGWEPILPRWTDPDSGIEIVPLADSAALVEEGEAMDHCVGGEAFALACLRNEIRIVSLRRGGERLSTAEIDLGPKGSVAQHRGRGNAGPGKDARWALEGYRADPAYLEARSSAERREATLPERTQAELAALLEEWRPFLTGRWKRASASDFKEAVDKGESTRADGIP